MPRPAHKAYAFGAIKISVAPREKGADVAYDLDIRGHVNRSCACDDVAAVQAAVATALDEWAQENETRAAARTGAELEDMPPIG